VEENSYFREGRKGETQSSQGNRMEKKKGEDEEGNEIRAWRLERSMVGNSTEGFGMGFRDLSVTQDQGGLEDLALGKAISMGVRGLRKREIEVQHLELLLQENQKVFSPRKEKSERDSQEP